MAEFRVFVSCGKPVFHIKTNERLLALRSQRTIGSMSRNIENILKDKGGIARMNEVVLATSRRQVARALEAGDICREGRNTLYLPGLDSMFVAVFTHHGRLTCVNALNLYGIEVWGKHEGTHISVSANNSRKHSNQVVLHRFHSRCCRVSEPLLEPAIFSNLSMRQRLLVDPVTATIDAMYCMNTHLERLVILDSVLHKGFASKEQLSAAAKGLHCPGMQAAITEADASARSGLETLGRIELRKIPGLKVECGVVIEGVGEVDFLINGCLIVELDGYEYHCGLAEFSRDRARSREAMLRGFDTMRFTFQEVSTAGFLRDQISRYFASGRARANNIAA